MTNHVRWAALIILIASPWTLANSTPEEPVTAISELDQLLAGLETQLDETSTESWARLGSLNPAELRVLDYLLTAAPDELERFYADFEHTDDVYVAPDGSISSVAPNQGWEGWQLVRVVSLRGIIDQIRSIVGTINSRAANIQSRLPASRPDVRDLFQLISVADLTRLLDQVRDLFGPTLDLIAAQREGFDQFRDTEVFTFREDLHLMLDNLVSIWDASQQLVCLREPDYTPVSIELGRIRTLIDKAPPILLYPMFTALEQIAFDWRLNDLVNELQFDPFCEAESSALRVRAFSVSARATVDRNARQSFHIRRCQFLRNTFFLEGKGAGTVLSPATRLGSRLSATADILEQFEKIQKDDQNVAVTAVALGGGGAGLNVKNPVKVVAIIANFILARVNELLKNALDERASCLADDSKWEADLLSCSARVSYVLPEEDFVFLDELVGRRLEAVEDANLGVQDADTAKEMAAQAADNGDTRQAFICLCDAYQRLVLPGSQLPRVDCVEVVR